MIQQQYIELLKLRNTFIQKEESLAMTLNRTGGNPKGKELQIITEKAMFHFITEIDTLEKENKKLNAKIIKLEHTPVDMDLESYIKFQSKQISLYERNLSHEQEERYVGTEHKTQFIYDNKEYDMTLNIFWEKVFHVEISVNCLDGDYEYSKTMTI